MLNITISGKILIQYFVKDLAISVQKAVAEIYCRALTAEALATESCQKQIHVLESRFGALDGIFANNLAIQIGMPSTTFASAPSLFLQHFMVL